MQALYHSLYYLSGADPKAIDKKTPQRVSFLSLPLYTWNDTIGDSFIREKALYQYREEEEEVPCRSGKEATLLHKYVFPYLRRRCFHSFFGNGALILVDSVTRNGPKDPHGAAVSSSSSGAGDRAQGFQVLESAAVRLRQRKLHPPRPYHG